MTVTMHAAPALPSFGDRHELQPRRLSHVLDWLSLAVILVGDAVAFYQLAAVAMPDAQGQVVWALVAALSLAATVSMHYAGGAARARKSRADHPGRPWSSLLILAWLGLGGVAVWFRLLATGGASDVSSGGFGAAVDTGAATHVPMAALFFMLYLVGGATAYGIGYRAYNPARSAYFRAVRAHRRAELAYSWAMWRRDRVDVVPWWRRRRLGSGSASRAATALARPAGSAAAETTGIRSGAVHHLWHVAVEPTGGARVGHVEVERAEVRARAQADQLRQLARHRLAVALAEPASSSGLFMTAGRTPTTEPQTDQGDPS
jgi:hypothetical protein